MGFTGDTNSTSMVPVSFSRTMLMEVMMAQISRKIIPMMPGTKLNELFIWGLKSMCTSKGDAAVDPASTLCR